MLAQTCAPICCPDLGRVSLSPASLGSPPPHLHRLREQVSLRQWAGSVLRTWMGPTAGCPSSIMRSPSSSSWFTLCSWLSSSCCLKCWGQSREHGQGGDRLRMPLSPLPTPVSPTHLVLPPHALGVRQEVAPVLLQDALLLLGQGT